MNTIYVTLNDLDMADCDGNLPDINKYQQIVEKSFGPEYEFKWTVNRNTSGATPEPECIDDDGNSIDIENEIRGAMENAFQSTEIWS